MRSRVVTMSVSTDFDMLGMITTGKKVRKLDCLSIAEIVDMDVEVAGNEEFVRGDNHDNICVARVAATSPDDEFERNSDTRAGARNGPGSRLYYN